MKRFFNKLKQFCGIATRSDMNPHPSLAAVKLASARI
jgi:transposase